MGIEFTVRKFAYPVKILKLRSFLRKSQWFSKDKLKEYQRARLKEIIKHCYENVPYYRNLFDELALKPGNFQDIGDLKKLPPLTKDIIKKNFSSLIAKNSKKYRPALYQTSGTTREPMKFYLDKASHIWDFCYYWRCWSWAGYRLGDPFAQIRFSHFLKDETATLFKYSPLTKQLLINPLQLSFKNLDQYVRLLKKYRPLFLTGLPSQITTLALMLEKEGRSDISFKAVFTRAEKLLSYQRQIMEKVFDCPVLDSYGHMESTVHVSQCPLGAYHIHSEFGVFSIEEKDKIKNATGDRAGEIIGTSLHNFVMPFLRYRIGDLAVLDASSEKCPCGRGLPLVKEILGRTDDVLITPDERFIAGAHILFDKFDGILWYQLTQESKKEIVVAIVKSDDVSLQSVEERLRGYLKKVLGDAVHIVVEFIPMSRIDRTHKYNPIVSRLDMKDFI